MFSFFIHFSVKKFAKKDFFTIFVARLIGYSDMKSILRVFTIILLLLGNQHAEAFEGRTFKTINASNELADNSAQIVVCTKTGRMIIATLGSLITTVSISCHAILVTIAWGLTVSIIYG